MTSNEIIAEYEEGAMSKGDALSRLTDVAAADGVEATLRELPGGWREELESWIVRVYDNDIDSDDFLSFGDPEPDLVLRRRDIGVLREWIKMYKSKGA